MSTTDDEARELARKHYAVEEGLTDIFFLRDSAKAEVVRNGNNVQAETSSTGETIRLLEVNQNTIPSGVAPIQFGPAPGSGIHFPSVIVEVTPLEFERIKANQLALPEGWELGERIPKPIE